MDASQPLTGLGLSEYVMRKLKRPLTADDIWSYARDNNLESGIHGKTPSRTLQAQLYVNVKKEDSIFYQHGRSPVTFYLKECRFEGDVPEPSQHRSPYNERDLHPLLVSFVRNDPHFRCCCKTIMQEISKKGSKNSAKWLHPDIVGVYFPFEDFDGKTIDLLEALGQNLFKLFSFEMKRNIDRSNVREYYFQAVSNSSWANEGYLVALSIREEAKEELRGLNDSFGIGVIQLNAEDLSQSEIVFPSKIRENIDSYMVDRLISENRDFSEFTRDIMDNYAIQRLKSGNFDKVLDLDEIKDYCIGKGIL